MGKRVIRLTESELMQLVGRIVKEQEEMKEGFFSDKFGWIKDAAEEIAELFKETIMPEIPEDELDELKRKARRIDTDEIISNLEDFGNTEEGERALEKADKRSESLAEGLIFEGIGDTFKRILGTTGLLSGLGLTGAGFLTFISQLPGYIDFEFTTKVNEIVGMYCDNIHCGALGALAMFIGILMAIGGAVLRHRD
jgi:hypothetical protein